jgi:uncharacterized protein (DUF1778 family)
VNSKFTSHVVLHANADAKALIRRAAALEGISVSAFILRHAVVAARRVLAENGTYLLSEKEATAFVAACESPGEPTQHLRDLMARPRR